MPLRRTGAVFAVLAVLTLAACGSPTQVVPDGATPITVVTSTNVYGSIAEAVGGSRVTVESLINDPAADPHSYESTPADAVKVAHAEVVVFNGGGYDDWMSRLVESAGTGDRSVLDVTELSGLVLDPAAGGFNEHLWYSLLTVAKLAARLATDLGAADSAHATEYNANAAAFNAKVSELTTQTRAVGTAHPGGRVAVTEPVPGYLIDTAGLTDATPEAFAEAVEEGTDPPAAVLQQTLALFTSDPVLALILNAQTQTPTTDQVRQAAQTAGVPVVEVTETLPSGATGYLSWMGGQIDALAVALDRT